MIISYGFLLQGNRLLDAKKIIVFPLGINLTFVIHFALRSNIAILTG